MTSNGKSAAKNNRADGKRLSWKTVGLVLLALVSIGLYGVRTAKGDRYAPGTDDRASAQAVEPGVALNDAAKDAVGQTEDRGEAAPINLNTATGEELQTIRGIGPVKAEAILEYRRKAGAFTTIEELLNVKGIGEKTFEKIKGALFVQ